MAWKTCLLHEALRLRCLVSTGFLNSQSTFKDLQPRAPVYQSKIRQPAHAPVRLQASRGRGCEHCVKEVQILAGASGLVPTGLQNLRERASGYILRSPTYWCSYDSLGVLPLLLHVGVYYRRSLTYSSLQDCRCLTYQSLKHGRPQEPSFLH